MIVHRRNTFILSKEQSPIIVFDKVKDFVRSDDKSDKKGTDNTKNNTINSDASTSRDEQRNLGLGERFPDHWRSLHGGPGRTKTKPHNDLVGPRESLDILWAAPIRDVPPQRGPTSPAVSGDYGFVGTDDGRLIVLDISNGELLHTEGLVSDESSPGEMALLPPTVAGGKIFVSSYNTQIWALDAHDPTTAHWKKSSLDSDSLNGSGIAASEGNVYVSGSKEPLVGFDADSGDTLTWRIDAGGSESAVTQGSFGCWGVSGGFVGFIADNGEVIWEYTGPSENTSLEFTSTPRIDGDTVYAGAAESLYSGGKLVAIRSGNGVEQWTFDVDASLANSSPAVVDNVVYVGSAAGTIYAVDGDDGDKLWQYDTSDEAKLGSVAVADGVVYTGDEAGKLYAVDTDTGTEIAKRSLPDQGWGVPEINGPPVVSDGRVFVSTSDGYIYAIGE